MQLYCSNNNIGSEGVQSITQAVSGLSNLTHVIYQLE